MGSVNMVFLGVELMFVAELNCVDPRRCVFGIDFLLKKLTSVLEMLALELRHGRE
jgi:hypothetical protein